jgi:hypothetical protein
MPLKQSPTQILVGSIIGLALCVAAWYAAGPEIAAILVGLLIYEGWTLVNKFPKDTISEIIWGLAERPMVPFIFGVGCGWLLFESPFAGEHAFFIMAVGFLMGHFFFQRNE